MATFLFCGYLLLRQLFEGQALAAQHTSLHMYLMAEASAIEQLRSGNCNLPWIGVCAYQLMNVGCNMTDVYICAVYVPACTPVSIIS